MRSLASAILGASLTFGGMCVHAPMARAEAAADNALTAVSFTPRADSLEFVFRTRAPLTAEQVRVYGDEEAGDVLNLRIEGARVTRRWVQMPDAQVERALLHPGAKDQAAVLRVRMKQDVAAAVLDAVKIREAEGAIVVTVPRSAEVAGQWAQAEKAPDQAVVVVEPMKVEAPASAPAPAPAPASAVVAPSVAASAPSPADAPLTLTDSPSIGEGEAVVANAGVSESTGVGGAAVALFLLLGGGFVLWRKIRGHRPAGGTGRLIKPLGTHVLGPKQGLLLLDVAGEMVLLGTSDKGVQMLTKIDRERNERAEAPVAPVPAAPVPELELLRATADVAPKAPKASKLSVAERASAAIAKVRALNQPRGPAAPAPTGTSPSRRRSNRLETADEDVTADALERAFFDRADEHLAEVAEQIEDDFDPRPESFFDRLRKAAPAAVAPPAARKPAPAPKAATAVQNEAALANDILRKIRQLQGA